MQYKFEIPSTHQTPTVSSHGKPLKLKTDALNADDVSDEKEEMFNCPLLLACRDNMPAVLMRLKSLLWNAPVHSLDDGQPPARRIAQGIFATKECYSCRYGMVSSFWAQ